MSGATGRILRAFLSTLSLRRATGCVRYCIHAQGISIHALLAESDRVKVYNKEFRAISIHALLAESDYTHKKSTRQIKISIHALLAESDCYSLRHSAPHWHFYPRSPCGERQRQNKGYRKSHDFYPRSPCGERLPNQCKIDKKSNFYPRSPCGERPFATVDNTTEAAFLSTLSLRRATAGHYRKRRADDDFYPRSPCGERLQGIDDLIPLC